MSAESAASDAPVPALARIFGVVRDEFLHMLPPTIFFFVGFNLVVFSMNLVLSDYYLRLGSFLVATTAALVVGKAVLVADKMPFLRRLDGAPLIQPILFKTFIYWGFVFIARLLEGLAHFWIETGTPAGFFQDVLHKFSWHRFLFIQIWILVLFLIYVTASELNSLFGEGQLADIMFRRRTSEIQMSRRQRIKTLVEIGKLTQRYPESVLSDRASNANHELVGLITALIRNNGKSAA